MEVVSCHYRPAAGGGIHRSPANPIAASSRGDDAATPRPVAASRAWLTTPSALAADAFIYGYPLVYDLGEVGRFAQGLGAVPATPLNHSGTRAPGGTETKFVSINNDTRLLDGLGRPAAAGPRLRRPRHGAAATT